jgi:TorA maturation chaperone TorD
MAADEPSPQELLVLAALLAEPAEDALEAVAELAPANPWLAPAIQELDGLPLAQWQAEHTRLFVSGHPTTVCPPFASAYFSGQMHGPIVEQMQGFFRALGLEPDTQLPADYLGTLLECAARLADQGGRGGEAWHVLWEEFLNPWLPRFAADMQRGSRLLLYQELGRRLAGLCPSSASDEIPPSRGDTVRRPRAGA